MTERTKLESAIELERTINYLDGILRGQQEVLHDRIMVEKDTVLAWKWAQLWASLDEARLNFERIRDND